MVSVRQEYESFRTFLSSSPPPFSEETTAENDSIESNLKILADLQRESDSTRAQIALVQSQLNGLEQTEEADYWKAVNTSSLIASETSTKNAALQAQSAYSQSRLEALDQANVYDDVFRIYYDGHYARINGNRINTFF